MLRLGHNSSLAGHHHGGVPGVSDFGSLVHHKTRTRLVSDGRRLVLGIGDAVLGASELAIWSVSNCWPILAEVRRQLLRLARGPRARRGDHRGPSTGAPAAVAGEANQLGGCGGEAKLHRQGC